MSNLNEEELAAYAASVEGGSQGSIEMPEPSSEPVAKRGIGSSKGLESLKEQAQKKKAELDSVSLAEAHAQREHELQQDSINRGVAKVLVPVEDLPSKGLFYPAGTKIYISSATLGDIKRWSSMNEEDINDVTEKMQAVLESCLTITFGPESRVRARWKDLIEIDRFYLLLAIHDYTFPNGTNDVKVKVSEKEDIIMKKENIKFMEMPEKLMKYYNAEKLCFSFPVKNTKAFKETDGKMNIYISTIGVTDWLTDYIKAAERRNDNYDRDFIQYASLLIPDWRRLSTDYYYDLIEWTQDWGTYEWSLISKVHDVIANAAAAPTITYHDNGGVERQVPLQFRKGFKSLFQVDVDIDL